ncbi:MAG: YgjV family protein [Clostridia bacterium]|nr:YgjV family protein [Clostridia bacterium]
MPDINIPAQLVGLCGMATMSLSYQINNRKKIILVQTLNNLFWLLHFLMLGAMASVGVNIVSIVRNLLFVNRGRNRFFSSVLLPVIVCLAYVAAVASVWAGPVDLLTMGAAIINTVSLWLKSEKKIRALNMFSSPMWLVYNALNGSVAGIITEVCVMTSIIISIIRFDILKKEKPVKKA